jgi:hypothetical protein
MRRSILAVILALTLGFVGSPARTEATPGCRAFGQGLIAGHAQEDDERPGVGEEAATFAPANDDVTLFKTFVCG